MLNLKAPALPVVSCSMGLALESLGARRYLGKTPSINLQISILMNETMYDHQKLQLKRKNLVQTHTGRLVSLLNSNFRRFSFVELSRVMTCLPVAISALAPKLKFLKKQPKIYSILCNWSLDTIGASQ